MQKDTFQIDEARLNKTTDRYFLARIQGRLTNDIANTLLSARQDVYSNLPDQCAVMVFQKLKGAIRERMIRDTNESYIKSLDTDDLDVFRRYRYYYEVAHEPLYESEEDTEENENMPFYNTKEKEIVSFYKKYLERKELDKAEANTRLYWYLDVGFSDILHGYYTDATTSMPVVGKTKEQKQNLLSIILRTSLYLALCFVHEATKESVMCDSSYILNLCDYFSPDSVAVGRKFITEKRGKDKKLKSHVQVNTLSSVNHKFVRYPVWMTAPIFASIVQIVSDTRLTGEEDSLKRVEALEKRIDSLEQSVKTIFAPMNDCQHSRDKYGEKTLYPLGEEQLRTVVKDFVLAYKSAGEEGMFD